MGLPQKIDEGAAAGRTVTRAIWQPLWSAVRDLLWPPQCLGCDRPVAEQGGLCPSCWSALAFITPPHCRSCGLPFDHPVPGDLSCGACLADPPAFDRARAPFVYGGTVRRLILAFKHGDRTDMAAALAQRMAAAAPTLLAEADLIVPVPLHRWRLWRRRYNQAALLAQALARLTGRPAAPGLLLRRRATPSQGGLSRSRRARNVAGAFALSEAMAERIAGRRILLVDDVYTTGATVREAARVLVRGGAAAVDVIALARVVADRDAPAAIAAGAPARVVREPVRPIS